MRAVVLPIHIVAGLIAIVTGFVALFAAKGRATHRRLGTVFVYSMLVMSAAGAMLAVRNHQPENVAGGITAFYLVATGYLALRDNQEARWIDGLTMLAAIVIAGFCLRIGLAIKALPGGKMDGVPSTPIFMFSAVATLSAIGDARVFIARGIRGAKRLTRHLWRLTFAMFIAAGSFFIGQAKVFPKPLRIVPLLATPVLLTVILLIYWTIRVRFTRWYYRLSLDGVPSRIGSSKLKPRAVSR